MIVTSSVPDAPWLMSIRISTLVRPDPAEACCLSEPLSRALKGAVRLGLCGAGRGGRGGPVEGRRFDGVPARAAQFDPSGPAAEKTISAIRPIPSALAARVRPTPCGVAARTRQPIALTTATRHSALSSSIQVDDASVPVPRPWNIASGQQAYADQCTARQVR